MNFISRLFQLLERPNDWGLDVFQLAEVVSPSRALGVLGFTLFKVQRRISRSFDLNYSLVPIMKMQILQFICISH